MKFLSLLLTLGLLAMAIAAPAPLKPDVIINGDCRKCNVHGG